MIKLDSLKLRRVVKKSIERFNLYIRKHKNLPFGIELKKDLERLFPSQEVKTIFDVGANMGQSALWFRELYPEATIICFEPIRETYDKLNEVFRGDQNVKTFNFALGSETKKVEIQLQVNHQWNSLSKAVNEQAPCVNEAEIVTVEMIDSIMKSQVLDHVDLLKIDTEGYEVEVLHGAENALKNGKFAFIFIEAGFNHDDVHHTEFSSLCGYLCRFGYSPVSIYNQCIQKHTNQLLFADVLFRHDSVAGVKTFQDR